MAGFFICCLTRPAPGGTHCGVRVIQGAGQGMRIHVLTMGVALFWGVCATAALAETPALAVRIVHDYHWPGIVTANPAVEVFPLVSVVSVARDDGTPLTAQDADISRHAARGFCRVRGESLPPDAPARLDAGVWAFGACLPNAD